MAALLDNVTILHNQDQICVPDGGKSVSDDKAGSAFHQVIHSFLDLYLGSGINGGGSLIQDPFLQVLFFPVLPEKEYSPYQEN